MATTTTSLAPRKKRSIGKIIGIILALLIVPLVIGYFIATSEFFFKKVILPRAGAATDSTITVGSASISPFSKVILTKFEVKPHGKETLLKAEEVRLRYKLRDIIGGKITVEEIAIISPVITIFENTDGSSNLDPITKSGETSSSSDKKSGNDAKPLQLNIKNVSLKNALVQQTKNLPDGGHEFDEIANLNVSLNQLINGQPGKFEVSADARIERVPSAGLTNAAAGSLRAKLAGAIDYKLTEAVLPESAKGNLRFDISEAKGDMADLAKLAAIFNCDFTSTDIRQLDLQFSQNGQTLGALQASGPFSLANLEGKLKVELTSIDRRVLNLVGAASGMDFNATTISSDNELIFSQNGKTISLNGKLNANKLSVTKKVEKQTTPILELGATYDVSANQATHSALIKNLNINGTQNQQQILRASLSKPMAVSWGGSNSTPENATLQFAVMDLNLADWKSFAGEIAPSGKLNATLNLLSQEAGKQLSLEVTSRIENLSAQFGSNQISNAEIELKANADIADLKKVSLKNYSAQLSQNKQSALNMSGSGTVDLENNDADFKATLNGALAQLFKIVAVPDLTATSGTLQFDGQISQRKDLQTVKGNFALANFSGSYAGSPLDRFGAKFEADLENKQQDLQIRKLSGELQQAGQAGGILEVKGNFNSEKKSGNLDLKIIDLNENALRPFLAKSLGEKQLVTISVNGNTTAFLQENSSNLKGSLEVKNFVVRDPAKKVNDAPLTARLQLDGARQNDIFDLKQFQIALSPTARAKNQLNITGQLDMSKTNALKGKLLVQSDALDVTPFYDLYVAQPQSTNTSAASAPTPAATSNEEPEAVKLPVEQIVAEINIGQFYLREIEIKNWRGTAKIEDSRVLLNPLQMTLNNAPINVNADINLGVKGYAYDFSATLDKVPLEPLANSFLPENKGAYQGTIIANAKIKGAGMTGVNLKKTLVGNADLAFTNANIKVVGKRLKPFLSLVAAVLQTPELTASPVKWVASELKFGDGNIDLQNFEMQSDAFTANTKGIIPIANVLTDSPIRKFPVNFGLSYSLAQKARLTSSTTPTNSAYVMLPSGFLSVRGTLGDPKPDLDEKKLLGVALEKFGGKIPGVDAKTGNLIQGLGGILSGKPASNPTNQPPTTNPPAGTNNAVTPQTNSNEQLINGVLDLFNKKKKK